MRAPFASDCVRSVGLALPSPGIHTAPDRSSVRRIGAMLRGLVGRDELELDAEALRARHLALGQLQALRRLEHVEAAALLPAGGKAGLRFERRVELDAVPAHARRVARRARLADESRGVPGGAAGELALLEQHDVGDAELGEVIGGRGAGDAAADDDDLRVSGGQWTCERFEFSELERGHAGDHARGARPGARCRSLPSAARCR